MAIHANIQSDISRLLPEGGTPMERLLLSELRTGVAGRLLLVSLEGRSPDELARTSRSLVQWMRERGAFQFVGNGEQAGTTEERDRVFQYRYLLSPTVQDSTFSPKHLRDSLEERLSDLASPLSFMVKGLVPADPTGEFMKILQIWMTSTSPTRYQGVWFSSDLKRALILAETKADALDVASHELIQGQLKDALARLGGTPLEPASVHAVLTGPSVIAVEIQHAIQADVWRLSFWAAGLVTAFLFVSYRSVRIIALSLVPLGSAIVAGMVAVDLAFGFIHAITLGFGVTLLGVVDDYPIHLFSHLTKERRPPVVMREIWPTMRLGVVTTALGFSALFLSGFPGLSQLGLFAVAGLFTAAGVTRWVLPEIIPRGFEARRPGPRVVQWADRLKKAQLIVPVIVVLAIGSFLWSDTPLWEDDIANLTPISSKMKMQDQALRDELGVPDFRDVIVVEGPSDEEVLQLSENLIPLLESLVAKGALGGYDLAARYLPSRKTQQAHQRALPDRMTLERNLEAATSGLSFKRNLFQPFLDAVAKAKTQEPVDSRIFRGTALGLKMESLLFARAGRWVAVVPLRGLVDRRTLSELMMPLRQQNVFYLDLKEESNRIVERYRSEALRLLGWGALSISIVLLIGLRSPSMVLRVMLPIGSAIIVVAGLLHAFGERFSLFHLASFLLVTGLGLDYALFFNQRHEARADRERTLYGLIVCSTTTILVFGVLAVSRIPMLRAIGLTAALGSLACLLCAAFLAEDTVHDA